MPRLFSHDATGWPRASKHLYVCRTADLRMRVRAPHHRHHGPVGRVCKIDGFTGHATKGIRAVQRFGTWAISTIGSRSSCAARFLMPKRRIAYSPGLLRLKKHSAVLRRPRNGSRRASAPSRGRLSWRSRHSRSSTAPPRERAVAQTAGGLGAPLGAV